MQKHVEIDEPEEDREFAAEGLWPADIATAPGMGEADGGDGALEEELPDDMLLAEDGDVPLDDAAVELDDLPPEGTLDEEP